MKLIQFISVLKICQPNICPSCFLFLLLLGGGGGFFFLCSCCFVCLFVVVIDMISVVSLQISNLDNEAGIGNDVIGQALRNRHKMAIINCEDANENTPISEAASQCTRVDLSGHMHQFF